MKSTMKERGLPGPLELAKLQRLSNRLAKRRDWVVSIDETLFLLEMLPKLLKYIAECQRTIHIQGQNK